MPEAEAHKQPAPIDLKILQKLLAPARELAATCDLKLPRLPEDQATKARWYTKDEAIERALDVPTLSEGMKAMDRALDAIHDIAVVAFQACLDRLAGQASPDLEHNKIFGRLIMDRVDRYGLGLYYLYNGKMTRVRVVAHAPIKGTKKSPEAERAGFFGVATATDPSIPSSKVGRSKIGAPQLFPQLYVARSPEQAYRTWRDRQNRESPDVFGAPD